MKAETFTKGRLIHVQNTKSRRSFKARGSTGTRKGHPRNDVVVPKKRHGEPVSFCLPKSKKVKKVHPHSLSKSVSANRGAEKSTEMNRYIFYRSIHFISNFN